MLNLLCTILVMLVTWVQHSVLVVRNYGLCWSHFEAVLFYCCVQGYTLFWRLGHGCATVSLTLLLGKLNRRTIFQPAALLFLVRMREMWLYSQLDRSVWYLFESPFFFPPYVPSPGIMVCMWVCSRSLQLFYEMEMEQFIPWQKTAWVALETLIGWTFLQLAALVWESIPWLISQQIQPSRRRLQLLLWLLRYELHANVCLLLYCAPSRRRYLKFKTSVGNVVLAFWFSVLSFLYTTFDFNLAVSTVL